MYCVANMFKMLMITTFFMILILGINCEETATPNTSCPKSQIIDAKTDLTNLKQCSFDEGTEFLRMAYVTNQTTQTREKKGHFAGKDVDSTYVTHILYLGVIIKGDTMDSVISNYPDVDKELYPQITEFTKQEKKVCLTLELAYSSDPTTYKAISDANLRSTVAKSYAEHIVKNNFNCGNLFIIFAIAYEENPDVDTMRSIKENNMAFVQEIRNNLDAKQKELNLPDKIQLGALVSASSKEITDADLYDVPKFSELLDWIAVATFDYHGYWDTTTYFAAPFQNKQKNDISVVDSMDMWLCKGVPANKLVVAIASYGRTFRLEEGETRTSIGAKAKGTPNPGPVTRSADFISFYEIVDYALKEKWKVEHVPFYGSYSYKENQWHAFDDKYDVAVKAAYVKVNCFRGAVLWSLDLDYFQTDSPVGRYPLLSTMSDILTGAQNLADVKNAI